MSSVRIIAVPESSVAPLHIREQWVGVTIPLLTPKELSFLPRYPGNHHRVCGNAAVSALIAAGKRQAAAYWSTPIIPTCLLFAREVCELVE